MKTVFWGWSAFLLLMGMSANTNGDEKENRSVPARFSHEDLNLRKTGLDMYRRPPSHDTEAVVTPETIPWAQKGNLIIDNHTRGFLMSQTENGPRLDRIDLATGDVLWTRETEFTPVRRDCADSGLIFSSNLQKKQVVAIHPETGASVWTQDMGERGISSLTVECKAESDVLLVRWETTGHHLSALNKEDGSVEWTVELEEWPNVGYWTAEYAVLTYVTNVPNQTIVLAIDVMTGERIWSKTYDGWMGIRQNGDNLYAAAGAEVSRLDPETGDVLWTFSVQTPSVYLQFGNNDVYVEQYKGAVSKLSMETGLPIWSHDISQYGDRVRPFVLSNEQVVAVSQDMRKSLTTVRMFSARGELIWDHAFPLNGEMTPTLRTASGIEELYLTDADKVVRMDPLSGEVIWEHVVVKSNASSRFGLRTAQIADEDEAYLYVVYYGSGDKYPPQGIAAIHRETGKKKWNYSQEGSLFVLGSDPVRIFINTNMGNQIVTIEK